MSNGQQALAQVQSVPVVVVVPSAIHTVNAIEGFKVAGGFQL
jgi:hypothetical protein